MLGTTASLDDFFFRGDYYKLNLYFKDRASQSYSGGVLVDPGDIREGLQEVVLVIRIISHNLSKTKARIIAHLFPRGAPG